MSHRIEVRKVGFWMWEARVVPTSRPEPKHDSGVWLKRRYGQYETTKTGRRPTPAPRFVPENGLHGFTRAGAVRAARRWLKSQAEHPSPWEPAG
jgi:hypothetical protein